MLISKDFSEFKHNCFTDFVSGGAPILSLRNKIIGILHLSFNKAHIHSYGNFLNYAIKDFIHKIYYKNNLEEISIEKSNLSFQDIFMKKFHLIKKYLGKAVFKDLNELYLSFKLSLKTKYPNFPLNYESFKNIMNQMENYVCKIKIGNKEDLGFFCMFIPPNNNKLKLFITNNAILNEETLNKSNEKILITIKKENKIKELSLSNRKKYTSKEYNTTIIEIKEEDGIKNFLELDELIFNIMDNQKKDDKYKNDNVLDLDFRSKQIYMIQNKMGILIITYSQIESILVEKEKNKLIFYCNGKNEKLEGPIFSMKNKLIGLINNFEDPKEKNGFIFGVGSFLYYPIKEFVEKYFK